MNAAKEGEIFGPPTLNPKGRPRTTSISGQLEGHFREEDLAALLPLYGIIIVVCVERKGIRVTIAHLYLRACCHYIIT